VDVKAVLWIAYRNKKFVQFFSRQIFVVSELCVFCEGELSLDLIAELLVYGSLAKVNCPRVLLCPEKTGILISWQTVTDRESNSRSAKIRFPILSSTLM
jgi:hypothetical protein